MKAFSATLFSATLLLATGTLAQGATSLPVAARIRADLVGPRRSLFSQHPPQSVAGILVLANTEKLFIVVTPGVDTVQLPVTLVRAVHVSQGVSSRWRSAAAAGIPAGALSGLMNGIALGIRRGPQDPTPIRGGLQAAAVSGAIGAVVGALRPPERWRLVFQASD